MIFHSVRPERNVRYHFSNYHNEKNATAENAARWIDALFANGLIYHRHIAVNLAWNIVE